MNRQEKFLQDIEARQRNTVFPETLPNGAKVDGFIWFGSDRPTIIQRIGCGIFGGIFLTSGAVFMNIAWQDNDITAMRMMFVFASFWLIIGGRVFWNAIRPAKHSDPN